MTVLARTAEWICTRCGTTNRKLVPVGVNQVIDRCLSCKTPHNVQASPRPTRWEAKLAS